MIFNKRFENDINEVKKAIDLFSKTDDCGIQEIKKERAMENQNTNVDNNNPKA